jgi:DNA-binding HxlR family transcriptional regulator
MMESESASMAAPSGDVFQRDCAGRDILDHVTSRWATLILASLVAGPHRFSELNAKIGGISEKMLSQNLRTLVRDGLVKRTVTPTVPPQVSYSHTPLGADLTVQLWGLVSWIGNHTNDILEAQVRHDAATIHA